ncbi:hypothetical protein U1Q18_021667 [Sarracenia purpurea var. burkii]
MVRIFGCCNLRVGNDRYVIRVSDEGFVKDKHFETSASFGDHVESNQRASLDGRLENFIPSKLLDSNIYINQLGLGEEGLSSRRKGVTDLALVIEAGDNRGYVALYADVVKNGIVDLHLVHEPFNVDKIGAREPPCYVTALTMLQEEVVSLGVILVNKWLLEALVAANGLTMKHR